MKRWEAEITDMASGKTITKNFVRASTAGEYLRRASLSGKHSSMTFYLVHDRKLTMFVI